MEKRILLVGTSFAAVPFLLHLKSMGCRVAVCGKRPNEPCVGLADDYYSIDYSDTAALSSLVRHERFVAAVPDCNDRSYLSAATIADEFGFMGYDRSDVVQIILNKAKFRAFAERQGFPVPKSVVSSDANPDTVPSLNYPLLIKPVDSYSGRGISKVESAGYLHDAVKQACGESREGAVVLEEFKAGSLHSHSAWVQDGVVSTDFFVDEFCTVYPYQVNCSNSPSRISENTKCRIQSCINELISSLKLVNGLLHTQFILDGDNFYLIECTRRCPGDLYYHLISRSTGARYAESYVFPFLGEPVKLAKSGTESLWVRHTVSLPFDAVFWGMRHTIDSQTVETFPLRNVGSFVRRAPYDRMAILFARFDDRESLFRIAPKFHELVTVDARGYCHEQ